MIKSSVLVLILLTTTAVSSLETTTATAENCFESNPNDVMACLKDKGWLDPLPNSQGFSVFSDNSPSIGGTWMKTPVDEHLERYGHY